MQYAGNSLGYGFLKKLFFLKNYLFNQLIDASKEDVFIEVFDLIGMIVAESYCN